MFQLEHYIGYSVDWWAALQPRLVASLIIFLGSYFPLSLILLAQDFNYGLFGRELCFDLASRDCVSPIQNPEFSIPIFLICGLCFILALVALRSIKSSKTIEVVEAKQIQSELMSYTLPYVVSFMSLEYQETGKFIGVIIFLTWMFVITHRSGQIILNPVLIVFGWKVVEVEYRYPTQQKVHSARALMAQNVAAGESVRVATIQDILVAHNKDP